MKLALGGAQFGMTYGVANTDGKVSLREASHILHSAYESGVRVVDTAIAYGESEATLGQAGVTAWQVVSKLPEMPMNISGASEVNQWVEEHVMASLERLKVNALYGLLLHRPQQLLEEQGHYLYQALQTMKAKSWVHKIGVSIYQPDELPLLFASMHFDLVQAPLNIMDQRLLHSGWADRLHAMGVELHTRSAFLQGLLLMSEALRPVKFNAWHSVWAIWDDWLHASGLTPLEACLRFVYQVPSVSRVVIGVDNVAHLHEILQVKEAPLPSLPQWGELDVKLMNPAQWGWL